MLGFLSCIFIAGFDSNFGADSFAVIATKFIIFVIVGFDLLLCVDSEYRLLYAHSLKHRRKKCFSFKTTYFFIVATTDNVLITSPSVFDII